MESFECEQSSKLFAEMMTITQNNVHIFLISEFLNTVAYFSQPQTSGKSIYSHISCEMPCSMEIFTCCFSSRSYGITNARSVNAQM